MTPYFALGVGKEEVVKSAQREKKPDGTKIIWRSPLLAVLRG